MQSEIRHRHGHALEALSRRIQPRVKLAIHHITEILPQSVTFASHRRPPIERRSRADETMVMHVHKPRPFRSCHMPQEMPRLIDEIPVAVNHIRR